MIKHGVVYLNDSNRSAMSHKKLRNEKECLNCGSVVTERFCSHCGQENLELNDSVTHLVIHYVKDMFNYDSKLWHTLRALVTRPGLVAAEYMLGKRQSYLEPIRFYAFTSSIFFLVFFFLLGDGVISTEVAQDKNYPKRLYNLEKEKSFLAGTPDTMYVVPLINSLRLKTRDTIPAVSDTLKQGEEGSVTDSVETEEETEGWLLKLVDEMAEKRERERLEEYGGDKGQADNAVLKEVFYKLPQLFFLSLPFFAFILKMLYWRSRRTSYVEHFIFSIYHYAYLFIIMLLYILAYNMPEYESLPFLNSVCQLLVLGFFFYPFIHLLLSMKRFYGDRWGRLIFRFCILLFLLFFVMLALFVVIAVIAYFF